MQGVKSFLKCVSYTYFIFLSYNGTIWVNIFQEYFQKNKQTTKQT